jgi:hypothetical protein
MDDRRGDGNDGGGASCICDCRGDVDANAAGSATPPAPRLDNSIDTGAVAVVGASSD